MCVIFIVFLYCKEIYMYIYWYRLCNILYRCEVEYNFFFKFIFVLIVLIVVNIKIDMI